MIWISLDKKSKSTLTHQIYEQIRIKILNGELKTNEKLPSSRELSEILAVSRIIILNAYDMLSSEGYIEIVPNSGAYVAIRTFLENQNNTYEDYTVTALATKPVDENKINFSSGTPSVDLFPRKKWGHILQKVYNEAPYSAFGYDYPEGRPELRDTLVKYLRKSRGIKCSAEQIIITSGTKQSLTLIGKCLLAPDKEVWIEDPTNLNVLNIFTYHTKLIHPIMVDKEGIKTDSLPQDGRPTLIFVTPSHQFPLGGILSIQRRIELIEFARNTGCYIVEDDYDSEFRYEGSPIRSLQELDSSNVIYLGTFSKIMFPSLRLGYLVLPHRLISVFREWKRLSDHHSNSLNQLALMRFIENRDLEKHIAAMKKIYRKRRDFLIECLYRNFNDQIEILGKSAGMHIIIEFKNTHFTTELIDLINNFGVNLTPVEELSITKGNHTKQLIVGYAHLNENQIEEGVCKLKKAISSYL